MHACTGMYVCMYVVPNIGVLLLLWFNFQDMLNRVLRAPMSFFHANPVGRVTNRFAKDIADVDKNSMPNIQKFIQSVFSLIGSLVLMCTTTVYTTALVVPMFFGFYFVVRYVLML